MTCSRVLIVNADDFGQSPAVNNGVIKAHLCGIVTSTSLMVRHDAAQEAVELSRTCPALSIGLHLDLGEWCLRDGEWVSVYEVVELDDRQAIADEIAGQLAAFRSLVGRNPTHIDSHQHVHLREPMRSIVERHARELAVPLRRSGSQIRYCGDFYGQDIDGSKLSDAIAVEGLIGIMNTIPSGITELCCHPAAGTDLKTMYSTERCRELATLCDPRVRAAIVRLGITLCSFHDFRAGSSAGGTTGEQPLGA
jgi:predicted glycoside hydrolase/deacetylase ChbG (UPF0249 family)